jgi:hypothetical protein
MKAERNGKQVYFDSARPLSEITGGNKYLFGAVDEIANSDG